MVCWDNGEASSRSGQPLPLVFLPSPWVWGQLYSEVFPLGRLIKQEGCIGMRLCMRLDLNPVPENCRPNLKDLSIQDSRAALVWGTEGQLWVVDMSTLGD